MCKSVLKTGGTLSAGMVVQFVQNNHRTSKTDNRQASDRVRRLLYNFAF
jgi:hypothetical protein